MHASTLLTTPLRIALFIAAPTCVVALTNPAVCIAQEELQLEASVDSPLVEAGQPLTYTLRITSNGRGQLQLTREPNFGAMKVLRRSRSNQTRITSQGTSAVYTLTYQLQAPSKDGKVIIRSAEARGGSARAKSNPVIVKVVPRGKGPPTPKGLKGAKQAFIQTTTNPSNPYIGQQVIVQYKLFLDRNKLGFFGADLRGLKDPSFDGFWIEDLTKHIRTRPSNISVGGRQFSTQAIKTMAVFPLNEGDVEIGSADAQLLVSSRESFGRREVSLATEAVKLNVRPLPPGAPKGFSKGNVGVYEFRVNVDKTRAAVGEPISLRLEVTGQGMLRRVELPKVDDIDGFRALEPVFAQETRATNSGVYGSRRAEIVLTPEREGKLLIPAMTLITFDPTKGEYQTLRSSSKIIDVRGKAENQEKREELIERERNDEPEAVKIARRPLEALRPLGDLSRTPPTSLQSATTHPLFFGVLGLPFALLLSISALSFARRRNEDAAPQEARREVFGSAQDSLQAARDAFANDDASNGYSALTKAITRALAAQYDIPPGAASDPTRARSMMIERGASEDRAERVHTLLTSCNDQRFSPSYDAHAAQTLLDDVAAQIQEIGKE